MKLVWEGNVLCRVALNWGLLEYPGSDLLKVILRLSL